uniref:Uncharacterized protein n=1 Tax=Arundo donax TaxID=35708 RepID=A0A0A9BSM0_ARUDO
MYCLSYVLSYDLLHNIYCQLETLLYCLCLTLWLLLIQLGSVGMCWINF